jgi:pimeloyl-ACP methyl ester carboxylesterase
VIRALQVPKVDVYGDSYGSWFAQVFAASPVSGTVPGPAGTRQPVSMGVVGLVNLVSDSAEDPAIYAALDAAARALLDHDRPAPLLRLYASRLAVDESYFGVPVSQYSVELYMALSCLDYPQLFPMSASGPARVADLAAAEAALPASTFAPFTTAQWLAMDQNTENYTACLDWPAPTIAQAPVTAAPPFLPPHLPVLILGGSLDTWTPPAGVPEVQAEIGGDSRFVEFANETHVVGEGDSYGCASSMIQAFVTDPATLASLSTSCAAAIPSLRAVGSYPVARYSSVGSSPDAGLYGGSVTTSASGNQLTLTGDELVPVVRVSGTVTMGATTVTADLSVRADGTSTSLTGSWPLYGGSAAAAVTFTGGSGSTQAPEGVPF